VAIRQSRSRILSTRICIGTHHTLRANGIMASCSWVYARAWRSCRALCRAKDHTRIFSSSVSHTFPYRDRDRIRIQVQHHCTFDLLYATQKCDISLSSRSHGQRNPLLPRRCHHPHCLPHRRRVKMQISRTSSNGRVWKCQNVDPKVKSGSSPLLSSESSSQFPLCIGGG
jgi:hypothetical protein